MKKFTSRLATVSLAGALMIGAPLTAGQASAASGSQSAGAARAANCHLLHHIPTYRSARATTVPVITQIAADSFAPGYSRVTTRSVTTRTSVTASAKIAGKVNTKLGNKFIGQAEVELSTELQTSGSKTNTKNKSVKDKVVNNSRHNATFVFYRGTIKASAGIKRSVCVSDHNPGNRYWGHIVWRKAGKWQSWTVLNSGALRCGAGTKNVNRVGRTAMAIGCR